MFYRLFQTCRRAMAPRSKAYTCPICYKTYYALSNHFQRAHSVKNVQERKLLLQLARGRVNVRDCKCPLDTCTYSSGRLDKHLFSGHPELSTDAKNKMFEFVKRAKTVELLQAVRDTEPSPPLTSSLTMEGFSSGLEHDEAGAQEPPTPTCSQPPCSDEEEPGPSAACAVPSAACAVPSAACAASDSTPASACEGQLPEPAFPASLGKTCLLTCSKCGSGSVFNVCFCFIQQSATCKATRITRRAGARATNTARTWRLLSPGSIVLYGTWRTGAVS